MIIGQFCGQYRDRLINEDKANKDHNIFSDVDGINSFHIYSTQIRKRTIHNRRGNTYCTILFPGCIPADTNT